MKENQKLKKERKKERKQKKMQGGENIIPICLFTYNEQSQNKKKYFAMLKTIQQSQSSK